MRRYGDPLQRACRIPHCIGLALAGIVLSAIATQTRSLEAVPGLEPRPNILVIVADDLGYTDLGAYGGEIATPHIDSLADSGLLLTNFHTLPTCAPTRAALLTGTDNHTAGIGSQVITPAQEGQPGYEGYLNERVVTIAEVLQGEGYRTYHAGKWHLGTAEEHDPRARGFQETFTLIPGGASHFADATPLHPTEPVVYRRNGKAVDTLPADFYSTRYYTDSLLSWLELDKASGKPFFAYLAYTAPHDPLHAPTSYIEKYRGRYDEGFEVLRRQRFAALKARELIADHHELPPWPAVIPRWDTLSSEEQANKRRDMEVYAAMIDVMDEQIGRVLHWLQNNGELENTLVVFFSDNGANGAPPSVYPTHTREFHERFDNRLENRGAMGSFVSPDAGWATASTAAFRLFKLFSTEGGIRTPAIIRPPAGSPAPQVSDRFVHVRDLMPTFLELAGADHPAAASDAIAPMQGQSLLPLVAGMPELMADSVSVGYELHGTRAFIKDGWKILRTPVPMGSGQWQLYDLKNDPGELNNLAFREREKRLELISAYNTYALEQGIIHSPPGILGVSGKIFNGLIAAICLLFIGFAWRNLSTLSPVLGARQPLLLPLLGLVELISAAALLTIYGIFATWLLLGCAAAEFARALKARRGWLQVAPPVFVALLVIAMMLLQSGLAMSVFLRGF